jgi:hypothetical protein
MLEARGLQAAMKLIGAWITVEAQGGTVPYRMANLIYPASGGQVQSALSFLSKMCFLDHGPSTVGRWKMAVVALRALFSVLGLGLHPDGEISNFLVIKGDILTIL